MDVTKLKRKKNLVGNHNFKILILLVIQVQIKNGQIVYEK